MWVTAHPPQEPNFTFVLNGKEFNVDIFIFGRVSKLFQKNLNLISAKRYEVQSNVNEEAFKCFLNLCQGHDFIINDCYILDTYLLCEEFQVEPVYQYLTQTVNKHADISLLKQLKEYDKLDNNEKQSGILDHFASHFSSIMDKEEIFDISPNTIFDILTSQNLNIRQDQSLVYDFIKRYTQTNNLKNSKLYGVLDFSKLSAFYINDILSNEFFPDSIETKQIFPFLDEYIKKYQNLKREYHNLKNDYVTLKELKKDVETISSKANDIDKIPKAIDAFLEAKDILGDCRFQLCLLEFLNCPFQSELGLFQYFIKFYKKNPVEAGIISIYSSQDVDTIYPASNLLEYENSRIDLCYFHDLKKSQPNEDNYIEFDFKQDHTVNIIGFALRTNVFGETISHPKEFSILGSNNREKWDKIFTHTDRNEDLKGSGKSKAFNIPVTEEAYRYIRYVQHETHFPYKDRFGIIALSAIEFYGQYQ